MNAPEMQRELISRYVDGDLNQEERVTAERLLKESPELRTYCEQMRQLDSVLDRWAPEAPSSAWEAVIERKLLYARSAPARSWGRRFTWALGGTTCALAAVLVTLITVRNYIAINTPARTNIASNQRSAQQPIAAAPIASPKPVSAPSITPAASTGDNKRVMLARVSTTPSMRQTYNAASSETLRSGNLIMGSDQYEPYYSGAGVITGTDSQSSNRTMSTMPKMSDESWRYNAAFNTEQYTHVEESRYLTTTENPLSTFSIDVDTASYANTRRFLSTGSLPPIDAVRIEEMINYFTYNYPQPEGTAPFSITVDRALCPWSAGHQLVRIGLRGKVGQADVPSNLVFLIDVSGSMEDPNKLPLLKTAFRSMVERLSASEHVAIVVYAGAAGLVLDSTPGNEKQDIYEAIDKLKAGGSTAGGAGIQLAYQIARQHFIKEGNNRVILATDGDFNVGISSEGELVRLIEKEREDGIFLTVLGFGTGNYQDARMEQIADKGNGNYYYIDTEREGRKVLGEELGSTLFTIAKDVKIQIEFNPAHVKAYRLVGYENRRLAKEDFNDDKKDAGEMGAGHTVTALYEIVPADSTETFSAVDPLVFQQASVVSSKDMLVVKLRYKEPSGTTSQLITQMLKDATKAEAPTGDVEFAAAVAEFGLLLRQSPFKGSASYDHVLTAASESLGTDPYGYRAEFMELVRKAKQLQLSEQPGPGLQPVDEGSTPSAARIQFKGQ